MDKQTIETVDFVDMKTAEKFGLDKKAFENFEKFLEAETVGGGSSFKMKMVIKHGFGQVETPVTTFWKRIKIKSRIVSPAEGEWQFIVFGNDELLLNQKKLKKGEEFTFEFPPAYRVNLQFIAIWSIPQDTTLIIESVQA